MTEHPLTDELCLELSNRPYMSDIRMADMRAAADWQLDQMIELIFSTKTIAEPLQSPRLEAILGRMASELRTSMRPTKTQEDS